jgi:hypothetical protein
LADRRLQDDRLRDHAVAQAPSIPDIHELRAVSVKNDCENSIHLCATTPNDKNLSQFKQTFK